MDKRGAGCASPASSISVPAESLLDQMEARTGLASGASAEPSRVGSHAVFLLLEVLPLVLMAVSEAHLLEVSVWNNRLMLSTKINLYEIFVK